MHLCHPLAVTSTYMQASKPSLRSVTVSSYSRTSSLIKAAPCPLQALPVPNISNHVQLALGHDDGGLGFALVRGARHAGHDVVVAVCVNDDAVLAQLLLDENDLHARACAYV
eukprot:1160045-Pelagomonas_calceolata.AAC.2